MSINRKVILFEEVRYMYEYYENAQKILNELIEDAEIKGKSLTFYRSRINKFFSEYMGVDANKNKPLNAITYFDINTYLENLKCSDAEKVNYYNSLKRFFEYAYYKNETKEIMSHVTKPIYIQKPKRVLNDNEYNKIKKYIVCKENDINDRLILGLFLFTGLSRQYIASLRNNQFVYDEGVYKLIIWKGEEQVKLPLKAELQLLINEYCTPILDDDKLEKVIKLKENFISTYIGDLTKEIIGKKYTPTNLSDTFVYKALASGNYIWEVSRLTLESVSTIAQHITNSDILLENRQTSILNSF